MNVAALRDYEDWTPKLSLVVGTIGRKEALRRLFESLSKEISRDFEVILVDQSGPQDREQVASLATEFSNDLHLRYLAIDGRGLSRARNLGLRHARGKYLGFPDDDCWYPGDAVGSVISFFERNPHLGILSGAYSEPDVANPSNTECELSLRNFFGRVSSVGLFLNRSSIEKAAIVFDERIGAGTDLPAGEETDLILRLLLAGVNGFYDPSLVIYHRIHRHEAVTRERFVSLRKAFWFVIGKNYRPIFSEAKLVRGAASCVVKEADFGISTALRAMLEGYWLGLKTRRTPGHGSPGESHSG